MQKGSAPILIVLLVVISSLGIFGYWYISSTQTPDTQDELIPPTRQSMPAIAPSTEPSPTIYTDPSLGFKTKIPQGFNVREETEEEYFKRANGQIRDNFTSYVQYPPPMFTKSLYVIKESDKDLGNAVLSIVVYENPENLSPEKFYNKYWYYPFIWGEFGGDKSLISPKEIEKVGGTEAGSAVVNFRESKPKFIYLPLEDKKQMLQIHLPSENNQPGEDILKSLVFE